MTGYTFFQINQYANEASLPALLLVNGLLMILIIALGFAALHLLFRHVDDREV